MRSERDTVTVRKCGLLIACLVAILAGLGSNPAEGRSLYVIAEITNSANPLPVLAYDIGVDGSLTFQAERKIPFRDRGAVGMAIDWESGHVFITYEASDTLQILDARTMADVGKVFAPGAENLAGVVYNETKDLLYAVDCGTDKLYAYGWNSATGKLTMQTGSPVTLEASSAYGIEVDEARGLLYTANGNRWIRVYDTTTWSLVETITLERSAVSLALDFNNELLYTGAGFFGDRVLNQYNMATGESRTVEVDEVAGVMGIAVDPISDLVYITTGLSNLPGGDDLLCYDPSLNLVASILDIGNPTDIIIPARDIGYNPLGFVKSIITSGEQNDHEEAYVSVGETIAYQLSFQNLNLVREVSIVDTLPDELTLVSAEGDGDIGEYDPVSHRYTWFLPSVDAGSQTSLELRARVNAGVPAGTRVCNRATIRTRILPPSSVSVDALVRGGVWKPLGLTKRVIGGVRQEDEIAYANAGDSVSYAITYTNEGNEYPAGKVRIVDTLPPELVFISAESTSGTAAYDPVNHTYTCSFVSLPAGETGRITLTAQIQEDVPAGTVLTNTVVLTSEQTNPTTATADITVRQSELQPLLLSKQIASAGTDSKGDGVRYVSPGDEVTYTICVENRDNDALVQNVSIVDFLPAQMTFVSAHGDGQFGHYDAASHTYVWSISALAGGESLCLDIVLQAKEDTPVGTVIVNRATIDSDQTEATSDQVEVVVTPADEPPLNVTKRISDGATLSDDGKTEYVGIGTEITYQICFDSIGSTYRVQGLTLVDMLPAEVTFVSAEGDGIYGSYDSEKHSYTWCYPSLLPDSSACVELVVRVRQEIEPGTVIENCVTVDSEDADPRTACVTAVAAEAKPQPLKLTKTVTGGAQGSDDLGSVYIAAGEQVTYTVCVRNDNDQAVDNLVVVDILPADVTFVSAAGDGDFGSYDRANHTFTWRFETLESGEQICADITVRVNDDLRPGTTITNRIQAASDQTTETTEDTVVVVELEPPLLTKTVRVSTDTEISGGDPGCASPGAQITYEICVENTTGAMITGVSVVDHLPAEVKFVSAEGDSDTGLYDPASHTFSWAYPALQPEDVRCIRLTVQLNDDLKPGQIIVNSASMDAGETPVVNDSVEVCVGEAPARVSVTFSPLILGRTGYNRSDQVTALLEFSDGTKASDIRPSKVTLDPGGITANSQTVRTVNGKVQIRATFDLIEVLAAIPENGITTLYVRGTLQSGLPFVAEGIVLVVAERVF